jgi:hypothetical protein
MTDIVELLRAAMPECCYPAEQAADEIERLRAELDALLELLREVSEAGGLANDLVRDRVDAVIDAARRKA